MMMSNLPLAIDGILQVHERVTGLDHLASGTHGEFINAIVLGPSIPNANVSFQNGPLWLFQQERIEIVLDGIKVGTGNVRDLSCWWEKNSGEESPFMRRMRSCISIWMRRVSHVCYFILLTVGNRVAPGA
jgi:hypothetical protein